MLSIFKKLLRFSSKESGEEEYRHPENYDFGDDFIFFDLSFETEIQVKEMISEVLSIRHDKDLHVIAKIDKKKLLVRITHSDDINKVLIDEAVSAIMESYWEILNEHGEDH